jgi:pyrroloquinoline quinone (PQQ) biosynthesis protein C
MEFTLKADEIVQTAQDSLKQIIKMSQKLELRQTQQSILNNLVDTLVKYIKAKAVWNNLPLCDNLPGGTAEQ